MCAVSVYAQEESTSLLQDTTTAQESTTAKPGKTTTTEKETTRNKKKEKNEAKKTLKEQKADLEKKMKENEGLLEKYKGNAEKTMEYIDALDERIGYLNEELNVLDAQLEESNGKIAEIEKQIKPLEKELKSLQKQYKKAQNKYDSLNKDFEKTYSAYCLRLRAMYVSGQTSVLEALLSSDDISTFINRLEMIRAVARSDTQLLKDVKDKIKEIVTEQDGINAKKGEIEKAQSELTAKQADLQKEQEGITSTQNEIADKKVSIAQDRAESDRLFAEYSREMQIYTEFRNEDEELIKKVDSEIDDLLSGLKDPSEVTTAPDPKHDRSKVTGEYGGDGELFSRSNAALALTYPAPGHYYVTQSFGHYRNGRAHTGIDFSVPMNSKIVAAQKGIVITVKRLNYSYGYYVMVYHGTDAKGRKIVTLYAHNSSILVSVGQSVAKGQQIAKSGSTGNSTGPHCHFEVIIDGGKVNPKNYLGK